MPLVDVRLKSWQNHRTRSRISCPLRLKQGVQHLQPPSRQRPHLHLQPYRQMQPQLRVHQLAAPVLEQPAVQQAEHRLRARQ